MSYIVLARRYRPSTFEEIAGQESIAETLRNAVLNNRVAHAYLFTGPRGVGKTSMARILAKVINCPNAKEASPCGKCSICEAISRGEDMDVIELDGASHRKVEEIKTILDNVAYSPARGSHKIYIIDEVHMLSTHAFNSLLKTLEEPPAHVNFVLATTEPQKVPETIRSRCQRFDFRALTRKEIETKLSEIAAKENIKPQAGLLTRIAFGARGSMRDSLSLMEQILSLSGNMPSVEDFDKMIGATSILVLKEILIALNQADASKAMTLFAGVMDGGCDPVSFSEELVRYARDVLVLNATDKPELLQSTTLDEVHEVKDKVTQEFLMFLISSLEDAKSKVRTYVEKRVSIEVALLYVARMGQMQPIDDLIKELRTLKSAGTSEEYKRPQPPKPNTYADAYSKKPVAAKKTEHLANMDISSTSDVKNNWSEIIDKLTHNVNSSWLMAFLPTSRIISAEENAVSVGFPAHAIDSMKGSFDEMRMRKVLEEALEKVTKKKFSVRIERDETSPSVQKNVNKVKQKADASDESVAEKVRTLKNVFPGAKIVR
ncbi:MAG: DNA polymerase III subunit gamma/tau [Planctomycetota bacterium]